MALYACLLFICTTESPTVAPSLSPTQDFRLMHYISWITPFDATKENATAWHSQQMDERLLSDISNSDDLIQRVDLQTTLLRDKFPFLGVNRESMFVNANGFLHFESIDAPSCQSVRLTYSTPLTFPVNMCFRGNVQTLNTTFMGGIGALLADLFPGVNYPQSYVSYHNYSHSDSAIISSDSTYSNAYDGVIVNFVECTFWANQSSLYNITVRVRLTRDGHISIYWDRLYLPNDDVVVDRSIFMTGVRDINNDETTSYLTTSSQQDIIKNNVWNTAVKGIYPHNGVSDISSQTLFHLCPISNSWCMTPNMIVRNSDHRINVTTLSMSCLNEFKTINCSFTHSTTGVVHIATAISTGNDDEHLNVFQCIVPDEVSTASSGSVFDISILGVFATSVQTDMGISDSIALLPSSDVIATTFQLTIVSDSNSLNTGSDLCTLSDALSASSAANGGHCEACSLCYASSAAPNITCLYTSLPCPSLTGIQNCQGNCPTTTAVGENYALDSQTFVNFSYSTNQYNTKTSSTCCSVNDMDCSGICYGNRVILPSMSTYTNNRLDGSPFYMNDCCDPSLVIPNGTACCYNQIPDCTGRCGGSTTIDCQGICGGNATIDCTGYCQIYDWNVSITDCSGVCGGNNILNLCGDCFSISEVDKIVSSTSECNPSVSIVYPTLNFDIIKEAPLTSTSGTGGHGNNVNNNLTHLLIGANISYTAYLHSLSQLASSGISGDDTYNGEAYTSDVLSLEITNNNNFPLNITLINDSRTNEPYLLFPTSNTIPCCNSTIVVNISVILTGNVFNTGSTSDIWVVKTIEMATRRGDVLNTDNVFYTNLQIYPSVTDCETIVSSSVCSKAPRCIFCAQENPSRLLRILEAESRRRLYFDLIPPSQSIENINTFSGRCYNGYTQSACEIQHLEANKDSLNSWLPLTLLLICFSGVILIYFYRDR